jgi:hypothetical protein
MWQFRDVELLCIRELDKLDLAPVDRIEIYQRFNLDDTRLLDCYESLTTRDEPIRDEEGMKLGIRTSLRIACAREKSRGPNTSGGRSPSPVQIRGPDLRLLISNIFQLPGTDTNGVAHTGPLTTPLNPLSRIDRASALPPPVNNADCSLPLRVLMIISDTICRWLPCHKRLREVVSQRVAAVHPNSPFRQTG